MNELGFELDRAQESRLGRAVLSDRVEADRRRHLDVAVVLDIPRIGLTHLLEFRERLRPFAAGRELAGVLDHLLDLRVEMQRRLLLAVLVRGPLHLGLVVLKENPRGGRFQIVHLSTANSPHERRDRQSCKDKGQRDDDPEHAHP